MQPCSSPSPSAKSPDAFSSFLPQGTGTCPFFFLVFPPSTLLPVSCCLFSWLTPSRLEESARAAMIKYRKMIGKYTVLELFYHSRCKPYKLRCGQGNSPPEDAREGLFHAASQRRTAGGQPPLFIGLWVHRPDLCLHAHKAFSLCACLSPNVPFPQDTGPTGLGAHPTAV